jgi:hypothetical protein
MADTKISALTALGAAPATGDLVPVVDVSDTTMAGSGTTKKLTVAELFTSPALTTPNLGTPSAGTLTNCTGLPVAGVAGLGTGVATALGINVGSAGAPVTLNGALGTPSSGAVTNLTGTASININGTVGATTPSAGTFTSATADNVFVGSGGKVDFGSGDVTVTHSANKLAFAGASSGFTFAGDTLIGGTSALELGTSTTPQLQVQGTSNATSGLGLAGFSSTAGVGPGLYMYRSKSNTIGNATVVASGDTLGSLHFYGAQETGTFATKSLAASIVAQVDGTVTSGASGDMPGKLTFSTSADGSATPTARMTIDSAGDVRVTTAGTNSASVVTVGGTQTLTNKTLTSPVLTTPSAFTTGGTITLAENTSIALDPAGSADGKYSGITIAGTAGATLAFGDLCYLAAADSRWELADADAASTSGDVQLGMCVLAAAADGDPTTMLLLGNIRADAAFPALTIGAPAYVGTTAGDIQTAQPSGTDDVIRRVGFALTADELLFNPSGDYVTHV